MFKGLVVALFSLSILMGSAYAQADALGTCLADQTSGKDRKDLARWVFVGMAGHPEMARYSKVDAKSVEEESRQMGAMVSRLLGESCAKEYKETVKSRGGLGLQAAFETLGRLAMQELIADTNVKANMAQFERYVDRSKLSITQ